MASELGGEQSALSEIEAFRWKEEGGAEEEGVRLPWIELDQREEGRRLIGGRLGWRLKLDGRSPLRDERRELNEKPGPEGWFVEE